MKKYKVALISANVGAFDPVFKCAEQDYDCDFFYYTENNLPFPLPNLNDRLRSKYVKIMTHRFLPDYDIYVWVDGSVEITDPGFVRAMVNNLFKGNDVTIAQHPDRDDVYDELSYIMDNIALGKEYLVKRYANEPLEEEYTFYRNNHMPAYYPLYVTRFFARWNRKDLNDCFNDWWNGCLEFVNFDQSMFSYVAWNRQFSIAAMHYHDTVNKFMKVHKH